jgi:hypothetical protein
MVSGDARDIIGCYSLIRKNGIRFSEKIMLKQKIRAGRRSNYSSSRSSDPNMSRMAS